MHTFLLR